MNVVFTSFGNDSIALIQWVRKARLKNVHIIYSDTGWAAKWWGARIEEGANWAKQLGFKVHVTESIGLENLVRQRKGWPRQGIQFCTTELKILPGIKKLEEIDPLGLATCLVGVRRAESVNRRTFPERIEKSWNHGGRELWAPLVDYTDEMRDRLLEECGFPVLPHRSMECFPCINSNRRDLRELAKDPDRIMKIEKIEKEMGFTSKGKPRTMFRPYRHQGATGIREIIRWAESDRGKYTDNLDDGTGSECDSGMCGL